MASDMLNAIQEGRKDEVYYLMTHSINFILRLYGHMVNATQERKKEGRNVLFNDALNSFYVTVIWRRTDGK